MRKLYSPQLFGLIRAQADRGEVLLHQGVMAKYQKWHTK